MYRRGNGSKGIERINHRGTTFLPSIQVKQVKLSYSGQGAQTHCWSGEKPISYFLIPKLPGFTHIETKSSSRQASLRSESIETELPPLPDAPDYGVVGENGFRSLLLKHCVAVRYDCTDTSQYLLNLMPVTKLKYSYIFQMVSLPS